MKTNCSFITTKIDLNFQSPKYDESKRHFHQKQITTHSVISELRYTYLAVRRMGAICACVLFKRRKLYNFMHCTLYTYQAKQRMFQNIFHFSYFANLKSDSKPKLPTHNIKYFMYLLFEGCVVFQQLPPPLTLASIIHTNVR